ncbi:bifunctional homocysteine S-methyltransferase/methylenetetrahydrofolate reductase [Sedimentisphaera salicampi]|uniref:Bifunctional homocysteine S-methyltransferase/5,10-methylenetetrahydrofolate reductase n=1 Tax=Sedimentisphaera salicampi TaxID=1941349 RepID=A0A1W6LL59_9BACT|nr:bifunctional homocysteine S-methyltransferase/methylenetetrahydrofolate reductase [Sedimentisphaera salicampi]ARN56530.1 Bifunctional homocysteine S-methyltransferase/5,10-methylenetetrahydrofolate reductase [Sedimentisphaera salicampi]
MPIENLVQKGVVIGDGAFGTMLYQKGVFINACFEELNLTKPDLIREIHTEYAAAGCDFLETNTYAANSIKLAGFGLADKVEEINMRGAELARECAGESLVAGSVGSASTASDAAESDNYLDDVRRAYAEQIAALDKAGVDLLVFETFADVNAMLAALDAAADNTDRKIIATLRPALNWRERGAERIKSALARVAERENVFACGFNCGMGPSDMLELLDETRELTDKPFCIQPNAGLPQNVDGRSIYMCTPEYMAEYSKRMYEKGADIIGGCCGTTPEHISEIAKAVKGVSKADQKARVYSVKASGQDEKLEKPVVPLEERSLVGRKLANNDFLTTVEITPPRSISLESTAEKAEKCRSAGVDAINIPDGPRASFRQSALATAVRIKQAGISPILHVCSRDKNIISLQSDMLAAASMGINDMLFVTGDPPKVGDYPDATGVFDVDAIGMARMARMLNSSRDIAGSEVPDATKMTIGVGVNPGANDFEREIERYKMKVEAGAEYCVTQPVFDLDTFFRFTDAISGYEIPVIAGIWPFTSKRNAEFMANEVPGIVVPKELIDRMGKADNKEDAAKTGIDIARESIEAIRDKIAGLAVSAPFGKVDLAISVIQ